MVDSIVKAYSDLSERFVNNDLPADELTHKNMEVNLKKCKEFYIGMTPTLKTDKIFAEIFDDCFKVKYYEILKRSRVVVPMNK
jgi:hypothetical protein